MANIGLFILFICFGIGLFYCLPVTIRDWQSIKEVDDEEFIEYEQRN